MTFSSGRIAAEAHKGGIEEDTPESQKLSEGSGDPVEGNEGARIDPVPESQPIGVGGNSS